MSTAPLQVVWQLMGNSFALMKQLGTYPDGLNPELEIHAGQGTLQEGQTESAQRTITTMPATAPDPLIAFASLDVFHLADIFASDGPLLVVGPAFMNEFSAEIGQSCRQYRVKVVTTGTTRVLMLNRAQLLEEARPDVELYAIAPSDTLHTTRPTVQDELYFVPGDEALPDFFRVPWATREVFIRDDIRQRIERAGLRGARYNFLRWRESWV